MTLHVFLTLLFIVSVFTGLFTEGIKNCLTERGKTYCANALAGFVSVGLSLLVGIAYVIMVKATINAIMIVYLIALILLSWLSAMVGYDKVVQAITQFQNK